MCLVFVAWRDHPRCRLVVAANRDEYHARPTAPAAPWDEERRPAQGDRAAAGPAPPRAIEVEAQVEARAQAQTQAPAALQDDVGASARAPVGAAPGGRCRILAGRDLAAGGTWLGVTADGRFAALTNVRGTAPPAPDAPSRGRLAVDFLRSGLGARAHAHEVAREADRYSGFNLLLADRDELFCVSNCGGGERVMEVAPGCHGLSNDRLNVPWPKVTEGLAGFRRLLRTDFAPDDLFALLADDEPAAEADLRGSGLERAHSARFIRGEVYGTRSSTVLCIEPSGALAFEERSFDARALETGRVAFRRSTAGDGGFLPAPASAPTSPLARAAAAGG